MRRAPAPFSGQTQCVTEDLKKLRAGDGGEKARHGVAGASPKGKGRAKEKLFLLRQEERKRKGTSWRAKRIKWNWKRPRMKHNKVLKQMQKKLQN